MFTKLFSIGDITAGEMDFAKEQIGYVLEIKTPRFPRITLIFLFVNPR